MADNVDFQSATLATPASATKVATDQLVGGEHVQYVKLMDGTLDGSTKAAVGANGLKVDAVGTVTANAGTGPFPVSDNAGSLTVDAPVGTPVASRLSDGAAFLTTTSGRLAVDASAVAVPVTDNAGSLTVDAPVGTPVFVRLSDGAAALVGQKVMASSLPVAIASDQTTLPAVAEGRAATLHVTGTAAVNTGVTVTLGAAGAGLFHYITALEIIKLYSVVGVANGAGVIITSTNLPGNPAWTTEQLASAAGTATRVLDYHATNPLKSSVANTATTIVCPVQLQTIWRVNVSYFTAV